MGGLCRRELAEIKLSKSKELESQGGGLIGGDPTTEGQVLEFIRARYGARSLVYLPAHVAAQVCKRPGDFVRAARRYCQPELEL